MFPYGNSGSRFCGLGLCEVVVAEDFVPRPVLGFAQAVVVVAPAFLLRGFFPRELFERVSRSACPSDRSCGVACGLQRFLCQLFAQRRSLCLYLVESLVRIAFFASWLRLFLVRGVP